VKIVFSRKGFDTSYGGAPSPIVDGRPVSLPIPGSNGESTSFASLGLSRHVRDATRGKLTGRSKCHDDPMFGDGHCWLGQVGAAQGHLLKQGVGARDVFLFFGLYAEPEMGERHHRIFGHMQVIAHGEPDAIRQAAGWREPPRAHPHFEGDWAANNCIWFGPGATARLASPKLRLTVEGGPLNTWRVPEWLGEFGLSYHANPQRWLARDLLDSAKRGQEFVCDIGDAAEPRRWLEGIMAEIEG
jgi:hypothetical protein